MARKYISIILVVISFGLLNQGFTGDIVFNQPNQKTKMTHSETAKAFFNAYTKHDTKEMLSYFTADATFEYVPYGDQGKGKIQESAAGVWNTFIDAFPDFKVDVKSVTETKDGMVVAETVQGGTQKKDVMGIANKGRAQYTPHVFFFTFDAAGKIKTLKAYWDNNTIYYQLGHTETHN